MMLPNSTRLTMPLMISPTRSLNSSYCLLALGFAHALHDHLLGGLGGDAAEIDRRQRVDDEVAELELGIDASAPRSTGIWVASFSTGSDHLAPAGQLDLAGLAVDRRRGCRSRGRTWRGRPSGWPAPSPPALRSRSMLFSRATASATCSSSDAGNGDRRFHSHRLRPRFLGPVGVLVQLACWLSWSAGASAGVSACWCSAISASVSTSLARVDEGERQGDLGPVDAAAAPRRRRAPAACP